MLISRLSRPFKRLQAFLLLSMATFLPSCDQVVGIIELHWQLVDQSVSRKILPSCELAATDSDGRRTLGLRVRLTVSLHNEACKELADQPECIVVQKLFSCDRARGTLIDVPGSGEDDYLMTVELLVDPGQGESPFVPPLECVSTPGPVKRQVHAGRITDLSVYQIIVHAIDLDQGKAYDLERCGPSE